MRTAASLPARARVSQLIGLWLLAAGSVIIVSIDLLFPSFSQTGLLQGVERLAILALILYGAWVGLTRAGLVARHRLTAWLAIGVTLLVWQSIAWWLALAAPSRPGWVHFRRLLFPC